MAKRILIVGADGMLGQALSKECRQQGHQVFCSTRNAPELSFDLLHPHDFSALLDQVHPEIVINCAALVDLSYCEGHPDISHAVNGEAVCVMTQACNQQNIMFVHISTDHFFTGDGPKPHDEDAPTELLNAYAEGKAHGEACAATYAKSLIVRTNITGFRGRDDKPTFIEWALSALRANDTINGFDDFYTSTIDAVSFSRALLELISHETYGLINLASSQATSKYAFLKALAKAMPDAKAPIIKATVKGLLPRRAESLGLDVAKAENILGHPLPDTQQVIMNLLAQEKSFANEEKIHKNKRLNKNEGER